MDYQHCEYCTEWNWLEPESIAKSGFWVTIRGGSIVASDDTAYIGNSSGFKTKICPTCFQEKIIPLLETIKIKPKERS